MDLYPNSRLAWREVMSERAAARHVGLSRERVRKILRFSVPSGVSAYSTDSLADA